MYILWICLFLRTCFTGDLNYTTSDFEVKTLPDAPDPGLLQYAGVLPTTDHDHNLFFWLVESQYRLTDRRILVTWLNGGPGCSSMDGMFLEIGPLRMGNDGNITLNKYAWTRYVDVLFVDQPYSVGFSTHLDANLTFVGMREAFTAFMSNFLGVFTRYKHYEIYLVGESFAGTMIPFYAMQMEYLDGIGLFAPWLDSSVQYFQYKKTAIKFGLINDEKEIEAREADCANEIASKGNVAGIPVCEKIVSAIKEQSKDHGRQNCFNMYNPVLRDRNADDGCGAHWPYELEYLTPYLRREDVREALNIPGGAPIWRECLRSKLDQTSFDGGISWIPELTERLPVFIVGMQNDFVCQYDGIGQALESLSWNSAKGFEGRERRKLYVDGKRALGTMIGARNLTFVRFFNASHMAPYDKPKESLMLLDEFLFRVAKNETSTDVTIAMPTFERGGTPSGAHDSNGFDHGLAFWSILLLLLAALILLWSRRKEISTRLWRRSRPGWYSLDEMRLPA